MTIITDYVNVNNVQVDNGIASGFSSSSYISADKTFSPGSNTWEIRCTFTTGEVSSYQGLWNTIGSTNGCSPFYIGQGLLTAYISSNGSSWDIASNTTIMQLSANTTYNMIARYDGTKYTWYTETDGVETLIYTINNSTPAYSGTPIQLGNNRGTNNPFKGSIDLSKCQVKIGDTIYWKPYTYYYVPNLKNCYIGSKRLSRAFLNGNLIIGSKKITKRYTLNGSSITDTNGVITNTVNNNWINTSNGISGDFDIIVKLKFATTNQEVSILSNPGTGNWNVSVYSNSAWSNTLRWYSGQSGNSGGLSGVYQTVDNWVFVRLRYANSKLYLSGKNSTETETLADALASSGWETAEVDTVNPSSGKRWRIGNTASNGWYLRGATVDLTNSSVNGELFYEAVIA